MCIRDSAGDGLQSPDVPALPADYPALHFIVGQGHHGNGGLRGVIGGAPLDGGGDDLPGGFLCLILQLSLDLLDLHGGIVADALLHGIQQVFLRLLLSQTGDLLQPRKLLTADLLRLSLGLLHIGKTAVQILLLAFKGIGLLFQGLFFLM